MSNPDPPRCDWDERLTRLLREDAPAAPPNLFARVRRRLWRRWTVRAGMAAALLLALGAVTFWRPRAPGPERVDTPPPAVADLPGSNVLFAGPPVDSFDVLARQQEAYLTALELPEEKTP